MLFHKSEAIMLVQEKNALEKARTRADRPGVRSDSPSTMFDKVLRAFSIGDLSFSDLQSSLTRLLKDGAPPDELLTVLRGRESIEPLPAEARENIVAVLQEAQPPVAAVATEAAERLVATAESTEAVRSTATDEESESAAMTRLIQEAAAAWDVEPKARPAAVAAPTPVNTGQNVDYKTMRLALGQREDDFAALQAEHSRVLGLLEARARSAAKLQDDVKELAAHLEQSRGALLAQQAKTREMEEVLAERIALEEALRKGIGSSAEGIGSPPKAVGSPPEAVGSPPEGIERAARDSGGAGCATGLTAGRARAHGAAARVGRTTRSQIAGRARGRAGAHQRSRSGRSDFQGARDPCRAAGRQRRVGG
jgi:hypothetical protein